MQAGNCQYGRGYVPAGCCTARSAVPANRCHAGRQLPCRQAAAVPDNHHVEELHPVAKCPDSTPGQREKYTLLPGARAALPGQQKFRKKLTVKLAVAAAPGPVTGP